MNMYNKQNVLIVLCTIMCLKFMACEKIISVELNHGELSDEVVFRDSVNAEAAINGLYLTIVSGNINSVMSGGMTLLTGLAGNELKPLNTNALYGEYYFNDISINNTNNTTTWQQAYQVIYLINACLEGLEKTQNISELKRKHLLGEAYQIRGFIYFNLLQIYGGVPLVLTTDYRINKTLVRSSEDKVYEQVLIDLETSKAYLSNSNHQPIRANYYSSIGLLSKVYFHLNLYQEAEAESTLLISSGKFKLENDLENVFKLGSNENIWSWVANDNNTSSYTREGFAFIPASGSVLPAFSLSDELIQLFDPSDKRKLSWIRYNKIAEKQNYYPFKYQVGRIQPGSRVEHYIILRLAEQYLIRAESRIRNGDIEGGLNDLNMIRQRAGLNSINDETDAERILRIIHLERRRELFCEWGNGWIDNKRLNILDNEMEKSKDTWSNNSKLFPIPKTEIENNPFLTQNPGY